MQEYTSEMKKQKDGSTVIKETVTRTVTKADLIARYQDLENDKLRVIARSQELEAEFQMLKERQEQILKHLGGSLNLVVLTPENSPTNGVEEKKLD